jgi:hypothetical protein
MKIQNYKRGRTYLGEEWSEQKWKMENEIKEDSIGKKRKIGYAEIDYAEERRKCENMYGICRGRKEEEERKWQKIIGEILEKEEDGRVKWMKKKRGEE